MNREQQYGGPERRRFPRIRGAVVEYVPLGEAAKEDVSFTKDVSKDGVCILIGEGIEIGTILCLKIYLPNSPDPIEAKGQVVWKEASSYLNAKTSKRVYYDVGMEFVDIDQKNKERLYRYIQDTLDEDTSG